MPQRRTARASVPAVTFASPSKGSSVTDEQGRKRPLCRVPASRTGTSIRAPRYHSVAGTASQVRPSNNRPAFFLLTPPHCLKKKGTLAVSHCLLISFTHAFCMGLAPGPDSPPTITQPIPVRSRLPSDSRSGSIERNRTAAGTLCSDAILSFPFLSSTETPIQIFWPFQTRCQCGQTPIPLGKNLKTVPMRLLHNAKDRGDKVVRHILVKQVAHRVHKYGLWRPPTQWLLQHMSVTCHQKPVAVVRLPHSPETLGHSLSVAIGGTLR